MCVGATTLRLMEGEVKKALSGVLERVSAASKARSPELAALCPVPRLVAVSKTKPKEMILEAYRAGQRHFGENYVQELVDKANDQQLVAECPEIKWHMIGHLQSNKVKKVVEIPSLYCIETVDSIKLASAINNAVKKTENEEKLKVFVQINTSDEKNKSGVHPDEAAGIVRHIQESCSRLALAGIMTIGAFDHDLSTGPNPDFQRLLKCKARVCEECCMEPKDVELSMGMSNDFEHAILVGSTNVRVGSTIFGARNIKK
ncbi:pyridoxal phosphate homeostasis protein-like isoform X1 [Portunus trituberculatus]|nr:pyridoxal phosphate homeostasis protein-like isoform X1 [Portunus trituberculatus]